MVSECLSYCPSKPIRLFIVDDHFVLSAGLIELLNYSGEFTVVGTAGDGATALRMLEGVEVDVLLLDLAMPGIGGLEVLDQLRNNKSAIRTVIFTGLTSDEAVASAFARGAYAVVGKYVRICELISTLQAVAAGAPVMDSRTGLVLRDLVRKRLICKDLKSIDLTVLRELAAQKNVKQVAAELRLCLSTVYKVRSRIMRKLELTSNMELIAAAAKLGLVSPAKELAVLCSTAIAQEPVA
jgi:DNA-binding NarL/FixJ family response regulator